MTHPISIRLDATVQATLEAAAKDRGIGLSTFLRELATTEAKKLRHDRIRRQSGQVTRYLESSPEAQSFYQDWGSLTPDET